MIKKDAIERAIDKICITETLRGGSIQTTLLFNVSLENTTPLTACQVQLPKFNYPNFIFGFGFWLNEKFTFVN